MRSTSADDASRESARESAREGAGEDRPVDRRLATVAAVMTLLSARTDLRGVHDLADHLDYGARWGI